MTKEQNGVLFYNGRYNEMHDFVALELVDGYIQFSFSLGTDVTRVAAFPLPGVELSDGHWHQVTVSYLNRVSCCTDLLVIVPLFVISLLLTLLIAQMEAHLVCKKPCCNVSNSSLLATGPFLE